MILQRFLRQHYRPLAGAALLSCASAGCTVALLSHINRLASEGLHGAMAHPLAAGVCWLLALRLLPLNRLYPLLSLSYVLVWLAAISLPALHETFRWSSLAGVILIVCGLLCVALPRR